MLYYNKEVNEEHVMEDRAERQRQYCLALEALRPTSVHHMKPLFARDVMLQTPLGNAKGKEDIKKHYLDLLVGLQVQRIKIRFSSTPKDIHDKWIITWDMLIAPGGKTATIRGLSEITYDFNSDMIIHQEDIFDPLPALKRMRSPLLSMGLAHAMRKFWSRSS